MNGIATTFTSADKLDLYWLDNKFAVNHKSGNGTDWDIPWDDLGGSFSTVPAAVAAPPALNSPDRLDVFGVGLDYAMYRNTFDGTAWESQWENLGGIFMSAPGVYERPDGVIDVFGVGLDYAMYHRFFIGKKTGEWERLGGNFSSTVSAASFTPLRLDVFARGADFTLRHRTLINFVWSSDWQNLGGSLASPPVAVSGGPNRLDVFAVGMDSTLLHRWWDSQIWSDWESLGGILTGTPSVVSWEPGRLDVFALGTDAEIYHFWFDNNSWNGREAFGGHKFTSGPTAIVPAPNRINLVAPGVDNNIYTRVWNGTQWTPQNWDLIGTGHMRLPTRYRFAVEHFHITNTRALDADTDTAQTSIGAGNWPVQTNIQQMGDVGGLSSPKEGQLNLLKFEPVTVELCEVAVFNYMILNNAHASQKNIDSALVKAGSSLTSDSVSSVSKSIGAGIGAIVGIEIVGGVIAPVIGSLLGSLVDFLFEALGNIVFADCDGLVAAEQVVETGRDLHLKTATAPISVTTTHPGTDSNTGCGGNSQYEVTWSITRL